MARVKNTPKNKKPIEQYEHADKKRKNNPPVGLVTPQTDRDSGKQTYAYDPHLDPQLVWAGKAEHTSFEVPTVSLHVHERIDPRSIVEAVRKKNGAGLMVQGSLFASASENPPLREAIDFYKHDHDWSNRLIAGDLLLVMRAYRGTVSLPFEAGDRKRVAVKIVDDRRIESLKIVEVQP